jgi:hypothetical protein
LGKRGPVTGKADTTGLNTGNWTIAFTPDILATQVPELLIYKVQIEGALGSSFDVYIENVKHDVNVFGNQNSWFDDSDQLVLRPGETLYFMYSNPSNDGSPPVATIFLRYNFEKFGAHYV